MQHAVDVGPGIEEITACWNYKKRRSVAGNGTGENCSACGIRYLVSQLKVQLEYYKHITIALNSNIFWVYNTDKATLSWLVSEIKNQIPSCLSYTTLELAGFINEAKIYNLQRKDSVVYSWALHRLIEDGWEPYSAPHIYQHHLRKLLPD